MDTSQPSRTGRCPDPTILVQPEVQDAAAYLPALQTGTIGVEVPTFGIPRILDEGWATSLQEWSHLLAGVPCPVSVHGPFLDLNPTSPEPGVRRLTHRRYTQALDIAHRLGASHVVFHTQFNANLRRPDYPQLWVDWNADFWSSFILEAEQAGVTVVLENMWDPCPDHIAALIDSVNSPWLQACIDTGHANLFSRVPLASWVQTLGQRLAHVHLDDNHGGWDEHVALGRGSINFEPFFAELHARDIHPWFVIEVETRDAVVNSLKSLGWMVDSLRS